MKSKIFRTLLAAFLGCGMIASDTAAFASGGPGGGGGGGGGGGTGGGGGGGKVPVGASLQSIANMLRGPWESLVGNTILTVTFNNNGTFTATIQSSSGAITTDAGIWTLTPAVVPSGLGNPQGHLAIVDSKGVVLLEGDFLVITADQFVFMPATTVFVPGTTVGEIILTKLAI